MNSHLLKMLIDEALDSEKVFSIEQHGKKYVRKDDIISQVYENPAMPDGEYQALAKYLEDERGHHNLGKSFDFFPPVVHVDQRGTYYQVTSLPTIETVRPYVEHILDSNLRVYEDSTRPSMYIFRNDVTRLSFFDYGGTQTDIDQNAINYQQFNSCARDVMLELGWTYDTENRSFLKDRPLDSAKSYWMDQSFDGRQLATPERFVAKGVYGRPYNLKLEEYPQDFQDFFAKILVRYGYVKKTERLYVPRPLELPGNISDIGYKILSDQSLLLNGRYGKQIIPLDEIRKVLQAEHSLTITELQIENQLLGRQGDWREPLVMTGFDIEAGNRWAEEFEGYDSPDDGGSYIRCLVKNRSLGADPERKHDFAPGLPVTLTKLFIDNIADTLVCVEMVGALSSVKANWAKLMEDRQVSYHSTYFKVGTSRNHKLFKLKLPSGMHQWSLIAHDASPKVIDSGTVKCYIMTPDKSDDVPADFIGILNKFLTIPLLDKWRKELWTIGRVSGLIAYTGNPDTQIGGTCWTVRRGQEGSSWENLIQAYLESGKLTF